MFVVKLFYHEGGRMGQTRNEQRSIAYFSMEIGLDTRMPTYMPPYPFWACVQRLACWRKLKIEEVG